MRRAWHGSLAARGGRARHRARRDDRAAARRRAVRWLDRSVLSPARRRREGGTAMIRLRPGPDPTRRRRSPKTTRGHAPRGVRVPADLDRPRSRSPCRSCWCSGTGRSAARCRDRSAPTTTRRCTPGSSAASSCSACSSSRTTTVRSTATSGTTSPSNVACVAMIVVAVIPTVQPEGDSSVRLGPPPRGGRDRVRAARVVRLLPVHDEQRRADAARSAPATPCTSRAA